MNHPDKGCDKNQSVQCGVPHRFLCVSTYYKTPQGRCGVLVDSFLSVYIRSIANEYLGFFTLYGTVCSIVVGKIIKEFVFVLM